MYLSVKDKVFLYDNKIFFEPYPSLKTARLRLKNVQMFPKMGKIKSWFWRKKLEEILKNLVGAALSLIRAPPNQKKQLYQGPKIAYFFSKIGIGDSLEKES